MKNILERLPELRRALHKTECKYAYEKEYVGEAIAYLNLFEDLLIEYYKDESKKINLEKIE